MTVPYVADSYGLDRALAAAFFHARNGETVSQRAALARIAGKRWGCVLCAFLSAVVEKDHCAKALSLDGVTASRAAIKAGIALWLLVVVASIACWAVWAAVFWLAGFVL